MKVNKLNSRYGKGMIWTSRARSTWGWGLTIKYINQKLTLPGGSNGNT